MYRLIKLFLKFQFKIMTTENKNQIVGFPIYDGVNMLDFAGASEVFADTANSFTPIWLAAEKREIRTSSGNYVYPNYCFTDDFPPINILFIPGGRGLDLINNAMFDKTYLGFIRENGAKADWCGSVCVGSFILASAGLLKNCSVTTHWSQINNLVLLKDKFNINVPSGYPRGIIDTAQKIFSGGGVSSSVDLALMLIETISGKKDAEQAQLFIQYAPDPIVHAGDPLEASPDVMNTVSEQLAPLTKIFFDAAQKLLNGVQ